jgi:membrane protease YdiL (CAAX protease family)
LSQIVCSGIQADVNAALQPVSQGNWKQVLQVLLVLAAIECALWTEGRVQSRWFVVALITLVLCVIWNRPEISELGIGYGGIAGASLTIPIAVIVSSAIILFAWWAGTLKILYGDRPVSWHAIFYAIWALEQQFILNSFFYRRFENLIGDNTKAWLVTATLFSLVHIPNPVLVPATFVGGLFFVYMFRRFRNIYPLALAHAMLGLTLAISVPDHWLHHMRVGLGFFRFHRMG